MNEIVVTGERVPSVYKLTPSSLSIITSTTLQNSTTLSGALSHLTDVNIPSYGWMGALSGISIRGASTSQSEVMLDGVSLNNAEISGFDLSTMPISGISSIEIVRGGLSTIYGGSAMGGVVNIIPNIFPSKNTFHLTGMAGSFGSYHLSATGKGRAGRFGFLISPGYASSKGNYPYTENGNSYHRRNADYTASWILAGIGLSSETNRVYFITHIYGSNKGIPGAAGMPTPQAREYNSHGIYILKYHHTGKQITLKTSLSRVNEKTVYFDNIYVPQSNPSRFDDTNNKAGITLTFNKIPFNTPSVNINTLSQSARSTAIGQRQRVIGGVGFEDRITPSSRIAIVPDISYQSISGIGDVSIPGFGIAAVPLSWLAVKASVSKAFMAPSFDDLYWPYDGTARGNPDLKPETKTGYTAGIVFSLFTSTTIEIDGFYDRYKNLIQWTPSNNIWMPENLSDAIIKAVEFSIHAGILKLLTLNADTSFMRTYNLSNNSDTNGKFLIYKPEITANGLLKFGTDNRYASIGLAYTGKRYITPTNTKSLPGFYNITATLSYKIKSIRPFITFTQYLSGETTSLITNYQYIAGYPLPGRYAWFGLEFYIQ